MRRSLLIALVTVAACSAPSAVPAVADMDAAVADMAAVTADVAPLPDVLTADTAPADAAADAVVPCATSAACEDGNPCTQDVCIAADGCVHYPISGLCSDGDPCTALDKCLKGACLGTPACGMPCSAATDCDDGDPCSHDFCTGAAGCSHTAKNCEDGNVCTTDVCSSQTGECLSFFINAPCAVAKMAVCASATCENGACVTTPLPLGSSCTDGDPCTSDDTCLINGCVGKPKCPGDQNACTSDCAPLTGACDYAPIADGTACDDGEPCTTVDVCSAGSCVGSVPPVCAADNNPCTAATATCVNGWGCNPPLADGTACSGSDKCYGGCCRPCPTGELYVGLSGTGTDVSCVPIGAASLPVGSFPFYAASCTTCTASCPTIYGPCKTDDGCGYVCESNCKMPGPCTASCPAGYCGSDGCGGFCGCLGMDACVGDTCTAVCASCLGDTCSSFDFESPLVGWALAGDATVITQLGEFSAPDGHRMLKLATSWKASYGVSSAASRPFCVSSPVSKVRFVWRYISSELKENCGSKFQDTFAVGVTSAAGTFKALKVPLDAVCAATTYGTLVQTSLQFDVGGDVWASQWIVTTVALPKPLTVGALSFEVDDVGDSAYDTAILLDDIELLP